MKTQMGRVDLAPARDFTSADVANKDLVLKMLKYEDSLFLGPVGKALFADKTFNHLTDLETYYTFHRATLAVHGFKTTDADVQTYRTIFRHYYRSPTDYDAEVLGTVCYMRENKCVYYNDPVINIGDKAPDCGLETTDGENSTLHKEIAALRESSGAEYVFVGAFSHS